MTTILIVDDIEENLYLLQVLLNGYDYQTLLAANGAEALEAARHTPPNMIISDILMPVMDGFALCRQWKTDEQLKHIPFVFYTATYIEPSDEEFAYSLGADRFIVKPQEPAVIIKQVREVLDESRAGKLGTPLADLQDEPVFLKQYSEALFRKLEDKVIQLEAANLALERDIAERKLFEEALRLQTEEITTQSRRIEAMNHQLQQQLEEKILADTALAENEAALETLINNVDESIFSVDQELRLTSFNTAFARRCLHRYGVMIEKGMFIAEQFPPRTRDVWIPLLERALRGEAFVSSHHLYVAQNETGGPLTPVYLPPGEEPLVVPSKNASVSNNVREVYNDESFNPIFSESGEVIGSAIFVRDVTESKRAEIELIKSEERFRRVVENVPLAFYIFDREHNKFLYNNPNYYRTVQQVTGKESADPSALLATVHPEDRAALVGGLGRGLDNINSELEYRVVYSSGDIHYMRQISFPIVEADDQILQFASFIEDVTERKRIEEALKQSGQLLASVLSNLPAGVAVTAIDGTFLSVNARYAVIFNRSPEEIVDRNVSDFLSIEQLTDWKNSRELILKTGQNIQYETHEMIDGIQHALLVDRFPLRDGLGNIFATGRIAFDITDQKQVQEQLREVSKQIVEVQEKERRHIARELHDEVGQSLTGVLLLLNQIERTSTDLNSAPINQIQSVIRQLMAQIRELSHNLHPPILDNHGLLGALRWYCNHYTTQTQIKVAFKYTGLERRLVPEIELTCYRVIQEALTNIARYAKVDTAIVNVSLTQKQIKLVVEDNGVGFDVEATRMKDATFGLAGMSERVSLINGKIGITSSPGTGTRISVEIPLEATHYQTNPIED